MCMVMSVPDTPDVILTAFQRLPHVYRQTWNAHCYQGEKTPLICLRTCIELIVATCSCPMVNTFTSTNTDPSSTPPATPSHSTTVCPRTLKTSPLLSITSWLFRAELSRPPPHMLSGLPTVARTVPSLPARGHKAPCSSTRLWARVSGPRSSHPNRKAILAHCGCFPRATEDTCWSTALECWVELLTR